MNPYVAFNPIRLWVNPMPLLNVVSVFQSPCSFLPRQSHVWFIVPWSFIKHKTSPNPRRTRKVRGKDAVERAVVTTSMSFESRFPNTENFSKAVCLENCFEHVGSDPL